MILFKIGSNDYTNNILNETYAVKDEIIYNEWTDGNYISHRDILRNKVAGAFVMRFRRLEEYESFIQTLNSSRTAEGYNICSIHCNNTHSLKNCNLFISIDSTLGQKDNLIFDYGEINVEVGEA